MDSKAKDAFLRAVGQEFDNETRRDFEKIAAYLSGIKNPETPKI